MGGFSIAMLVITRGYMSHAWKLETGWCSSHFLTDQTMMESIPSFRKAVPSGKRFAKKPWKDPPYSWLNPLFRLGKSIFNSFLYVYQRVHQTKSGPADRTLAWCNGLEGGRGEILQLIDYWELLLGTNAVNHGMFIGYGALTCLTINQWVDLQLKWAINAAFVLAESCCSGMTSIESVSMAISFWFFVSKKISRFQNPLCTPLAHWRKGSREATCLWFELNNDLFELFRANVEYGVNSRTCQFHIRQLHGFLKLWRSPQLIGFIQGLRLAWF